MTIARNFFFLFLYNLLLLVHLADSKCQKSFECGKLGSLQFPLARDPGCGLFMVDECDSGHPKVQLEVGRRWYDILHNISSNSFFIRDPELQMLLNEKICFSFENVSIPKSPYSSFKVSPNLTLFTCFNESYGEELRNYFNYIEKPCSPFSLYYQNLSAGNPYTGEIDIPRECTMSQVPMKSNRYLDWGEVFNLITAEFAIEWYVSKDCYNCHHGGGQCLTNTMNEFVCKRGIVMLTAAYFEETRLSLLCYHKISVDSQSMI